MADTASINSGASASKNVCNNRHRCSSVTSVTRSLWGRSRSLFTAKCSPYPTARGIFFQKSALQRTATHCNTVQHTATHCYRSRSLSPRSARAVRLPVVEILKKSTLQHTVTYCNKLQHTATHCNTLQHTATEAALFHLEVLALSDCPW